MPPPVPRWKTAIESAIAKYKAQTVVQITTLDTTRLDGPIPRVRSQIFREFLSSASAPSLPLLLSSTDVRTPKVSQLGASPEPRAELVWWIEDTQQQFRIIGDLYVVPAYEYEPGSSVADKDKDKEREREKRKALHEAFVKAVERAGEGTGLAADRDSIQDATIQKEWERRRADMFRGMSAHMKASWCRPTPGRPLEEEGGAEGAKRWPERVVEPDPNSEEYEEEKRNWEKALGNFALVVIDPVEVDFVDLAEKPNRRWLFTKRKVQDGWIWDEKELVP